MIKFYVTMIIRIISAILLLVTKSLTQPECYSDGSELMTVNAHINSTAIIQCPCDQTEQEIPQWRINDGPPLIFTQLPSRHSIIMSQNLRIFPVEQSDNGSTYQCIFQPFSHGIKMKIIITPREPIRIIEGPGDTSVMEGETAEFSCFFTGSSNTPCWIINGTVYSIDELPNGYSYRNHTLFVTGVDSSLNSTTYQCQILHVMSSVAILTVYPAITDETERVTLMSDNNQSVSSANTPTKNNGSKPDPANHSLIYIIGSAIGGPLLVMLVLIIVLIVIIFFILRKMKRLKTSNVPMKADAVYEELDLPTTFSYSQCPVYGMLESGTLKTEAVNPKYEEPLAL